MGSRNKATAPLKEYASQFTQEAIDGIVAIARDPATPPQARALAWDKVLDRAHGKATQPVDANVMFSLADLILGKANL